MFIYLDPSENRINSKSPIGGIESPGLEALTGADFVISRIPVDPVIALDVHIQNRSLFCQRKSGYDAIGDFNQIWLEIARMQACRIPMQQCFILPIGIYKPNDDGYLRIQGERSNRSILYETYLKNEAEWGYSGVQVRRLNDESELPVFVKAQFDELVRVEGRGGIKESYPQRPVPNFEPDNIWQTVSELDKEKWEYFLMAGLHNFGVDTIRNVNDYIQENIAHVWGCGLYALKVISDENEKGKAVHNVKGIGDGKRAYARRVLGLPKGFNLSVEEIGIHRSFVHGWYAALKCFEELLKSGVDGKSAFESCLKQVNIFFTDEVIEREDKQ